MLFLSASVWLAVAVLMAWGVTHLWSRFLQPRTLDRLLLPGTVAAHLGRILGLLMTGAAEPPPGGKDTGAARGGPLPKMPVLGPIIVGLVPLALLVGLVYLVVVRLGAEVLARIPADQLPAELPTSMTALWSQLRSLLTLGEATLNALFAARSAGGWRLLLFAYLMICLTVRMAPSPGNSRGQIGAVGAMGLLALVLASIFPSLPQAIVHSWPLLCLVVGWLLLLLLFSLLASGVILSARTILKLS